MCSIYNYIHLHIHKYIHIELLCLFVFVFAQQNKLSKNCRKGHLIRIFWTAASRFLSAPHPLLRRLVNACGLVFCRLTSSEFSFWKKKVQKKGQCFFFGGGKKKKGRAEEKGYLKCKYQKWKLVVFKLSQEKKITWTFSPKKKPSRFAQGANLGEVWPPSKHLSFGENFRAFWKSAWLLATLKDLGEIKNHVGSFLGPHGFWKFQFWWPIVVFKKKHTQQNKKKKAGHPSIHGDSTEKIAPISSLPAVKNFGGCGTTSRVLKDDFVMGWVPCMPCCALFWCLVFLRKIPWSSVEIVDFVGWSSNYTSVAKWTWFFGPKI